MTSVSPPRASATDAHEQTTTFLSVSFAPDFHRSSCILSTGRHQGEVCEQMKLLKTINQCSCAWLPWHPSSARALSWDDCLLEVLLFSFACKHVPGIESLQIKFQHFGHVTKVDVSPFSAQLKSHTKEVNSLPASHPVLKAACQRVTPVCSAFAIMIHIPRALTATSQAVAGG